MIMVNIWKCLKLRNSVPFIMQTLVNHVYNWILSLWLTFTVLQRIKTNFKNYSIFKISAKVRICDFVEIWKWLKLLNSVPFIKKALANHVYNLIWLFSLIFPVLQWIKSNFKIHQISRFLLYLYIYLYIYIYVIYVKVWKWLKLLNSPPFIKKKVGNHLYNRIWSFWLTFTVLQWIKTNFKNWSIFKISPKVWVCDFGQNLKMTKIS